MAFFGCFFAATLQSGLHLYTPADSGFAGVVSQVFYTLADSGSLGWSARVPIVYLSQLWFLGVVSQGSYYIPQLTGSLEWSARLPIVYPSQLWFVRVVSQGS